MRRLAGTIGFAITGLLSVIVWAAIDSRLCGVFGRLCAPPMGECGGGLDACAQTTHSTIDLFAYLFAPTLLFAVLGFCLFARRPSARAVLTYLACAIVLQWILTFVGTRILHV